MGTGDTRKGRQLIAAVILVGILAAAASAVVPFYSASYTLNITVLSCGLLPYLVYGVLGWLAPRGTTLHLLAVVSLVAHLWLMVSDRFMDYDGYRSGAMYYVPVVFAVLLLLLGILNAQRAGKALAPQ